MFLAFLSRVAINFSNLIQIILTDKSFGAKFKIKLHFSN
jgi:hypothetical protein